jgi:hypothetical protein
MTFWGSPIERGKRVTAVEKNNSGPGAHYWLS